MDQKAKTYSWSRSDGRWYHCQQITDLFGHFVVLIAHGGTGGRSRVRTIPVTGENEALIVVAGIGKRRRAHGYGEGDCLER